MDIEVRKALRKWESSRAPEDACALVQALFRTGELNFGHSKYADLPAAEVWDLFSNRSIYFTRNQVTSIETELKKYLRVHNFRELIQYAYLVGEEAELNPALNITHYYIGCWEVSFPIPASSGDTFIPTFKVYYEEEPRIEWKQIPHIFGGEAPRGDPRSRGPTNSVRVHNSAIVPKAANLLAQILFSVNNQQNLSIGSMLRTPNQLETYRDIWVWDERTPIGQSLDDNGWNLVET